MEPHRTEMCIRDRARFVYENEVQKWLDLIRGSYLPSNIDDMKLGQDKRPPIDVYKRQAW